jgi:hypothetical protein
VSLPDGSVEQRILEAVIDNKDFVKGFREDSNGILSLDRAGIISELKISGSDYDSGLKRLKTRHPVALKEWLLKKKLDVSDLKMWIYGTRN